MRVDHQVQQGRLVAEEELLVVGGDDYDDDDGNKDGEDGNEDDNDDDDCEDGDEDDNDDDDLVPEHLAEDQQVGLPELLDLLRAGKYFNLLFRSQKYLFKVPLKWIANL